jgi:cytochrome c-type biogenesis protein CcmH/NrfF
MIKTRRFAGVMVLGMAMSGLPVLPLHAEQTPERTRAIGKKLKCMCRGCQDTAATCYDTGAAFSGPCDTADLILQSFVQQYGQEVYIEPPHSGIGRVAWAMPMAYLVVGTGLVIFVISRWRKRTPQAAVSPTPSARAISPEALERARRRVAQDTED